MIELLTAVLVIVTGVYAYFTFRILRENQKTVKIMMEQNEAVTRPYITIRTSYQPMAIYFLHIANIGNSAAENLKLKIDKDYYLFADKKFNRNIKDSYAFSNTIKTFTPKAELIYCLGAGSKIFNDNHSNEITPLSFTITAIYSFKGKTVEESTEIDLMQYKGNVLYVDSQTKILTKIFDALKAAGISE